MAVRRFRDIGPFTFDAVPYGCVQSATIAITSDVLRGRCGSTVSERYQGLTNIGVEVTLEVADPFIDIHPGDSGPLSLEIPGAIVGTGIPGAGILLSFDDTVLTTHSGRIEKDSLGTGTYVFRALSSDGVTPPISITDTGSAPSEFAVPSDFIRDIGSFSFESDDLTIETPDFCARSFEFSENSELIEDFCQGDIFATYVGITGLNVTATATGRNIADHFPADIGEIGAKGTIMFSVLVGSSANCTSLDAGGSAEFRRMNINEASVTARHGEMSEVSISWVGHGIEGEEARGFFTPA